MIWVELAVGILVAYPVGAFIGWLCTYPRQEFNWRIIWSPAYWRWHCERRNMNKLTYEELREMAVTPSDEGAYSDSPLGANIGLHVHAGTIDVNVVVDDLKIATVFPDRTVVYDTAAPFLARLPEPQVRPYP